jgi:hypothetical protein
MNRTGKYTFRVDLAPLVVLTVHDDLSGGDLEEMFASWRDFFARKQRFVAIADIRGAKSMLPAKERARVAEWARSIEPLSLQYSLGTATVVSNALVRGTLTAIDWIHRPKVPQVHIPTLLGACEWCIERLQGVGIAPTPGIAAYHAGLLHEGTSRKGVG